MAVDIVLNGASSYKLCNDGKCNFPIENVSRFDRGAESSFALQVGFTAPYDHPRKHRSQPASHLGLR